MSKRIREYFRCTRRSELLTIVETNPKYMLNRVWCSVQCRHTEYTRSCEAFQLMLRKYFQYPSRCPLHNRIFTHILRGSISALHSAAWARARTQRELSQICLHAAQRMTPGYNVTWVDGPGHACRWPWMTRKLGEPTDFRRLGL